MCERDYIISALTRGVKHVTLVSVGIDGAVTGNLNSIINQRAGDPNDQNQYLQFYNDLVSKTDTQIMHDIKS